MNTLGGANTYLNILFFSCRIMPEDGAYKNVLLLVVTCIILFTSAELLTRAYYAKTHKTIGASELERCQNAFFDQMQTNAQWYKNDAIHCDNPSGPFSEKSHVHPADIALKFLL